MNDAVSFMVLMRRLASVSLFVSVVFAAIPALCAEHAPVAFTVMDRIAKLPHGGRPSVRVSFPHMRNERSLAIKLERTQCLGSCPDYSVEIHGDGTIIYEGKAYVVIPGRHTARIAPAAVRQLFQKFKSANFFWLLDAYEAPITDFPYFRTTLSFDGRSKAVTDYVGRAIGMPQVVSALETEIDRVVGTARWVEGNRETIPSLRAENWDFHALQNAGILASAAEMKAAGLVRELVDLGVPVDGVFERPGGGNQTALGYAAQNGDFALVKFLLAHGADANHATKEGETILMNAAVSRRPAVVAAILEYRPDVNAHGWQGETALMQAASFSNFSDGKADDSLRVVRLLIAAGADVNAVDDDGDSVLMKYPAASVAKALIEAGANPNLRSRGGGQTPLSIVSDPDTARVLLEAGADPWAKVGGLYAYERARSNSYKVAPVIDRWMAAHPKPDASR